MHTQQESHNNHNDDCDFFRNRPLGRVTLAKMTENSLHEVLTDATPHIALEEAVLTKKYSLQLYSYCCYVE